MTNIAGIRLQMSAMHELLTTNIAGIRLQMSAMHELLTTNIAGIRLQMSAIQELLTTNIAGTPTDVGFTRTTHDKYCRYAYRYRLYKNYSRQILQVRLQMSAIQELLTTNIAGTPTDIGYTRTTHDKYCRYAYRCRLYKKYFRQILQVRLQMSAIQELLTTTIAGTPTDIGYTRTTHDKYCRYAYRCRLYKNYSRQILQVYAYRYRLCMYYSRQILQVRLQMSAMHELLTTNIAGTPTDIGYT